MNQGSANHYFGSGRQRPHKSDVERKLRDNVFRVVRDECQRRKIRPSQFPTVNHHVFADISKRRPERVSFSLILHVAMEIGAGALAIRAIKESKL